MQQQLKTVMEIKKKKKMKKTGSFLLLQMIILMMVSAINPEVMAQGSSFDIWKENIIPYQLPPYKFRSNELLSVTFKTSPEVLQDLVPYPLKANTDNLMKVIFAIRNISSPVELTYYEAMVAVPVKYNGREGLYYPVRYVDRNQSPLMGEHEVFGFSYKSALVEMAQSSSTMRGAVVVDGKTVIDLILYSGNLKPVNFGSTENRIYTMKYIPSSNEDYPADVNQLIAVEQQDFVNHEYLKGNGKLYFTSTASEPLGEIPILSIEASNYINQSFILETGEVVHDFLLEGSTFLPGKTGTQ